MAGEQVIVFRCPRCGKYWGFVEQFSHTEDDVLRKETRLESKQCPDCAG
ncbi:MAG: hypothetical protein ACM3WV_00385 [Bacillota bacterium]